jgi:hypothetical protein
MIPFPYRMTKEGFLISDGTVNEISIGTLSEDIKGADQTLYCEDDGECDQIKTVAADCATTPVPTGTATEGSPCISSPTCNTPASEICGPDMICGSNRECEAVSNESTPIYRYIYNPFPAATATHTAQEPLSNLKADGSWCASWGLDSSCESGYCLLAEVNLGSQRAAYVCGPMPSPFSTPTNDDQLRDRRTSIIDDNVFG